MTAAFCKRCVGTGIADDLPPMGTGGGLCKGKCPDCWGRGTRPFSRAELRAWLDRKPPPKCLTCNGTRRIVVTAVEFIGSRTLEVMGSRREPCPACTAPAGAEETTLTAALSNYAEHDDGSTHL